MSTAPAPYKGWGLVDDASASLGDGECTVTAALQIGEQAVHLGLPAAPETDVPPLAIGGTRIVVQG